MALRDAGYETFATGKWHNGQPALAASFPKAKSIYLGGMSGQFNTPVSDVGTEGKMINLKSPNEHCSETFANEAIDFLQKTPKDKPFAAYIAFKSPHDPRQAPKKFVDMYNPKDIPIPANYLPEHPFNNGELVIRDERLEKWPRSKSAIQQHLAEYYAIITHEDEQIGKVIKALKETGRFENTIIIFSADNGLAIGSHGLMGKQNVYEHSVKIPLVISGPGIEKNKRSQAMCYTFDLFPTFCEAAGAKTPASVEGKSLWPILKGTAQTHREEIFSAYRGLIRGLNDGRYKLIVNIAVNKTQLFDLQSDPDEMKDLADDATQKPRLDAMIAKLKTSQENWADKQELKSEKPLPLKIDLSKIPEEKGKAKKKS
jgi:arylsulfatase A-like enzyme